MIGVISLASGAGLTGTGAADVWDTVPAAATTASDTAANASLFNRMVHSISLIALL